MQGGWEIAHINILVCAVQDIVIIRPQKSQEVMLSMVLTAPLHTTIKMAAMLPMIAYHASDMHHTGAISSYQCKEDLQFHFAL
jgi:hypothetical protein